MIIESMQPDEYVGFQGIGRDESIAGISARTFVCRGLARRKRFMGTRRNHKRRGFGRPPFAAG